MQEKFDDDLVGPPIPSDGPPTGTSHVFNLIQDVWLLILPLCGIRGVLAIGQTCKRLRALACDKYLWIVLIRDLEKRLFLDIPPGTQLHALSTSTLMSLARRTVQEPLTWSTENGCVPIISRTYRMHPPERLWTGNPSSENEVKLLPGGRYILFSNMRELECWNVAEDRLMWTHESAWGAAGVKTFAAEIVDSGEAAVVVVCQRAEGLRKKIIVEIIRLDFVTETSQLLLLTYTPRTVYHDLFSHLQICGDLVSVEIQGKDQTLLIKLSTAEVILLHLGQHELVVIEGYLVILLVYAGFRTVKLEVLAEEALQPFWRPAPVIQPVESGQRREEGDIEEEAEVWAVMSTEDVRGLVSWTTETPSYVQRERRLSAHKCPIVDGGEYVVWVYVSLYPAGGREAYFSSVYKFRLTLPSGHSGEAACLSLRRVATTNAGDDWPIFREISYTGHATISDDQQVEKRLLALAEPQTWEDRTAVPLTEGNDLDEETLIDDEEQSDSIVPDSEYTHISTYSGAITYWTFEELVVNYYE